MVFRTDLGGNFSGWPYLSICVVRNERKNKRSLRRKLGNIGHRKELWEK